MGQKRGPEPERLKIEGMTWQQAIKKALSKPRPPEGWPKPPRKPSKAKKSKAGRA